MNTNTILDLEKQRDFLLKNIEEQKNSIFLELANITIPEDYFIQVDFQSSLMSLKPITLRFFSKNDLKKYKSKIFFAGFETNTSNDIQFDFSLHVLDKNNTLDSLNTTQFSLLFIKSFLANTNNNTFVAVIKKLNEFIINSESKIQEINDEIFNIKENNFAKKEALINNIIAPKSKKEISTILSEFINSKANTVTFVNFSRHKDFFLLKEYTLNRVVRSNRTYFYYDGNLIPKKNILNQNISIFTIKDKIISSIKQLEEINIPIEERTSQSIFRKIQLDKLYLHLKPQIISIDF